MPYELYLIRHGLADERGEKWPDDTKRPLTERGMSRLRKQARGLDRLGVSFDLVLTSPLVRARQTAEILAAALADRPAVATSEALAPGGTFQALVADLQKHPRRERIALVGHEPGLGELAARLIGAKGAITLKKGAVCRIDVDALPPAGPGTLVWLLPPRVQRSLRR
jgi:phosphohistidine phosphatase